jgi:hypothetical protein
VDDEKTTRKHAGETEVKVTSSTRRAAGKTLQHPFQTANALV